MRSVHWFVLFKHLNVAKKGSTPEVTTVHFWSHHKSMKKSMRKWMPKNSWKSKKNDTKTDRISIVFGIASHENRVFWKRCMYEKHTISQVNRSRKRKVHLDKNLPPNDAKTMKNQSQNRPRNLMWKKCEKAKTGGRRCSRRAVPGTLQLQRSYVGNLPKEEKHQ